MANNTLLSSGHGDVLIGGRKWRRSGCRRAAAHNFNTLIAGSGNNTLTTSGVYDTLIGGSGADTVSTSGSGVVLIGGGGTRVSWSGGVIVLVAGTGVAR